MRKDSTSYAEVRPVYDTKDCSVRALAVATGCSYEQASAVFSAAGRVMKKGTSVDVSRKVHETWLGMLPTNPIDFVAAFVAANPKGRFILHSKRHAFAVIDGVVHDWEFSRTGPGTRVIRAWEVTEASLVKMEKAKSLFA